MRRVSSLPIAIVAAALGISTSALAQEAPKIFAGSNGEIEATYSDNCVVYYNANGSRKNANANCSKGQKSRADDAVARYRSGHGGEGAGSEAPPGGFGHSEGMGSEAPPGGFGSPGSNSDVPEIIVGDDGRLQVNVGTRCSIYYDRHDNYDRSTGVCSHGDRRAADEGIEAYRREQGDGERDTSGSGFGNYNGVPIYRYKSGSYQANMEDGCTIYFRSTGVILSSTKNCTSMQKSRATLAVMQFQREHPSN